MNMSFEV